MPQLTYVKIGLSVALCLSLFLIAESQVTDPREVNALRAIKNSLIDHGKLNDWRKGDPCTSNWTGVNCYNTTLDDDYLHVKELLLLNLNLSGSLAPELGLLSNLRILDFMWNNLTGSIPKEIGNISTLQLLLLNGNQLAGSLPDELGNLSNLDRIQIDQNQISGEIPLSFANLSKAKHFHMNDNSLSGQIPPDLYRLPILAHLLLDNNNLSGYLPPQLSETPSLEILQLDNNNFEGSRIPSTYGNMSHLLKLSLRNCSLQGPIPDWSNMPAIAYIDLSWNQLNGSIPSGAISENITTIDLSNNKLNGTIPVSFSRLPLLQKLSLANNSLSGSIPSTVWQNRILNEIERLLLDFEYNKFSNISGTLSVPQNVSIGLQGNPACSNNNLIQFCGGLEVDFSNTSGFGNVKICDPLLCPPPYDYAPVSPTVRCFCAAPLYVGYRMKSPGFSDFLPYAKACEVFLSSGLGLEKYQLDIDSVAWQKGPRLRTYLKIFPSHINNTVRFNRTEILRIRGLFTGWKIPHSEVFGPFELLNFTLSDLYASEFPSSSGISKGALVGIILGTIAGTVTLTALVALLLVKLYLRRKHASSKRRLLSRISKNIDGVKDFTYAEMAVATNNFNSWNQVGEGGYGKVYRGVLTDETIVAIKRAQEGSRQGEEEFLTEIDLLSRLHHRNLVSLVGYCDEEGEQMLVYEFMSNGSLRDHLSGKSKAPLHFATRLRIALASARGILYLHAEANPPIFHRDIKSSNILLDSKLLAKVSDFGLSRLAPVPELEGAMPAYVSTVVKGTPGYLDPEYFRTQKYTDKSDVYSLGVVFLELLTGMQPIFHGKNIVREVNDAYSSGMIFSVIDERMGSYPSECVEKFVNLALNCCRDDPDGRPSMSKVVRELENIWYMIPESDTRITESLVTDAGKFVTPPSSASSSRVPYSSQGISDNELITGIVSTVVPR